MKKSILKRWWFWLIIVVVIGVLYAALSDKETANPEMTSSITEAITNVPTQVPTEAITNEPTQVPTEEITANINFDKSIEDLKEEILVTNKESFSFAKDIYVNVDEVEKIITITVVVSDSTDKATSADFADTLIRRFGFMVNMNGGEYEAPTNDYYGEFYGGLYDEYDIMIGVSQESKTEDANAWLVNQAITKGTHEKIIGDN